MTHSPVHQPPSQVFLDVSVECNLRCVQCDIWKLKNPPNHLNLEERRQIIRQVAPWSPQTHLVLTGGELFLRREMLYETAAICREFDVYTTISSNGTLIRENDYERLPTSGIRCIVLSIDSHIGSLHDQIRGVPGTFKKVTDCVRRLVQLQKDGAPITVLTSTILGEHNIDHMESMVDFLESLGVDNMLFQPIQPVFSREWTPDWNTQTDLFPKEINHVHSAIDTLIRLKHSGHKLFQSESQFEDMRHYFQYPHRLLPGQCASMDRALMIDIIGQVRLCFNMERIGLRPIAHVREKTLQEIWFAQQSELIRRKMHQCQEGCGSMICHAR